MEHKETERHDPRALRSLIQDQLSLLADCMMEKDQANEERDRAIEDRDRATTQCMTYYTEILQLNETIARLEGVVKKQEESMQELTRKSTTQKRELEAQVGFLTEQVEGKRAVWYEFNPKSAARSLRRRNPFCTPPPPAQIETPTKNGSKTSGSTATAVAESGGGVPLTAQTLGQLERMAFRRDTQSSPTPTGNMPFGTDLPCGPAKASLLNFYVPRSNRIITAHNGYTENAIETYPATSLIPFETNEDIIEGFVDTFDDVYAMVCGWVTTYADKINPVDDVHIAQYPRCWMYMLGCLSPLNEKEATKVVYGFQRDRPIRRWFVMRMIVQYIYLHIWSFTNWLGFNKESDANMNRICLRLIAKGLPILERGDLLAERTTTVKALVEDPQYRSFRKEMIGKHTKKLRDLLPLVLNTDADRASAARDLSAIVTKAFDLSARLFTCGWTFIITMPEAGTRFVRPSMRAANSDVDALELQIRLAKIKFAVTPFVTIRDDSGLSIVTKNIDKASVLIEE